MNELLLSHFSRYPKMQLIDMVKLICQSEFAGGHIIKNANDSLKRLEDECRFLKSAHPMNSQAFEDIGGGLCRLHLRALGRLGIGTRTANRLFVATAQSVHGSSKNYESKLRLLQQCCENKALPFFPADVDPFISQAASYPHCPLVSHSAPYHAAYHPAYRVIKTAYGDYIDVFKRIDALLEEKQTVTVAIDGGSAGGKTTLANWLFEVYDCNVFHMDDFFLPTQKKTPLRLSEPGGNVDYERFSYEVAAGIKRARQFAYRPYSCKTDAYKNAVTVAPKPLNIVEGVYSLHPALCGLYDLKLFLKTDEYTQLDRIKKRNGEAMLKRFAAEWIPLENAYFHNLSIEQSCDLVFAAAGENK